MTNKAEEHINTVAQSFSDSDLATLTEIIRSLQTLPADSRIRILESVNTFFGLSGRWRSPSGTRIGEASDSTHSGARFSDDRTPSPKDFLFEKKPKTDLDRVACLAYYLSHYRDTPHFKTLDISKLNTEAAQHKFSNAANAVDNATKSGVLVPATKGAKQITSLGELYVQALPDRVAARQVLADAPRRRPRKSGSSRAVASDSDET